MPLPEDWPLRRIRVLRRDGYQCQHRARPGAPKCLGPAHRIEHVAHRADHSLDNLQTRCVFHSED